MISKNLTCLFMTICFFSSCGEKEKDAAEASSLRPVKYIQVMNQNITGQHTYTGLAKAEKEASLSFRVGGTISSIKVKVGDKVRKGQSLASLDATDYQVNYTQSLASVESSKAQIESAQAQLESARASYITAKSNYTRFENLYETKSISLSDFEQAKSSYAAAEASYKAAQTQVTAAEAGKQSSESIARSASNQVSYTRIVAPFSGIITRINAEPNELVGQGNPIFELNSLGNPNIEIGVPENVISEIKNGQPVSISFNSLSDQQFMGSVNEIGYSSSGSTYPVTIRLSDTDDRIRPGMPASATFSFSNDRSSSSAIIVPSSSVGKDKDGNFVYVIENSNESYICKKKVVTVGRLSDGGFEIKTGLSEGVMIASAGLNILRDGMEVSLYNPK